jgi:hypothetical protein
MPKKPKPCEVCTSEHRKKIEAEMLRGVDNSVVAGRWGVSTRAVNHHEKVCVAKVLHKARKAHEVFAANSVRDCVLQLRDKTLAILDQAEKNQDFPLALKAIKEAKGILELMAKVSGEINTQAQNNFIIQINITEEQSSRLAELDSVLEAEYYEANNLPE